MKIQKISLKKAVLLSAIVLLYAVLVSVSFSFFYDDLAFDFAGYAGRAFTAFDGFWTQQCSMGIPSSTFNQFLPAILAFFFKFLGLGEFTLPIALSSLLIRLLIPLAFIFLGRIFKIGKLESILLGLVFVLNPITFKFLNRYYELVAWFFFIIAFAAYFKFLEEKTFNRKFFVIATLASAAVILSHTIPAIFLALALFFLVLSKKDLFKALLVGGFAVGLSAFWFFPMIFFRHYSVLSEAQSYLLQTTGILASSALLIVLLALNVFFFRKLKETYPRLFQFFILTLILSLIQFVWPSLPLLAAIFTHSFHVFYILALLLGFGLMFKENIFNRKILIGLIGFILVCTLIFFPIIQRQYIFTEPKFSDKPYNQSRFGENIGDFSQVKELLEEISVRTKDNPGIRFETLPNDVVIKTYAHHFYRLGSLDNFSYFPLKDSGTLANRILSMQIDCDEFNELIEKSATVYWISLNQEGFNFLERCGLEPLNSETVTLFSYPKKTTLVENGKLLEFENTYMKLKALPPGTKLKVSYFPRWTAFLNGKMVEIIDLKPGMQINVGIESVIEVKYLPTSFDLFSAGISILSSLALLLLFIFTRTRFNVFDWERIVINNEKSRSSPVVKEHIERYKFACQFVKNKKVLDAACGTGYGSKILSEHKATVVGVDKSPKAIAFAKKKYCECVFKEVDIRDLKFDNWEFDVVVSFETIEHLKDHQAFLSEVLRVLKKNGVFIVSTPNEEIRKNIFTTTPNNPFHFKEFTAEELRSILETYFDKVELFGQCEIKGPEKSSLIKIVVDAFVAIDFLKIRKYFLFLLGGMARPLLFQPQQLDFKVKKYAEGKKYCFIIAVCKKQ